MPVQPVPFGGLGLAWRLPKGTRPVGCCDGPELTTQAKACQPLKAAKADLPLDTDLSMVMWNNWSSLRQKSD